MKFNNKIKVRLSGRHFACAEAIDYTDKKILNIGCGNGSFEFLVADKAKEIVGVDIKYEDILQAKKECKDFKNVNFVETNILKNNMPKSSADIVAFFDAIEHIPKGTERKALEKIYNILKSNGQVVISTPLNNFTKYLDPAWYFGHRHYTKEQIVEFLVDVGFEVEKIYTCGGFYEMISMLLFYPFKHILNMEIPFKKFFDKKRLEEYQKSNGYVTLFVIGRKNKSLASCEILDPICEG